MKNSNVEERQERCTDTLYIRTGFGVFECCRGPTPPSEAMLCCLSDLIATARGPGTPDPSLVLHRPGCLFNFEQLLSFWHCIGPKIPWPPDKESGSAGHRDKPTAASQGTLQSGPAAPVGSQHSCQPAVKLHILPLVWIFPLGKG